VVAIDGTLYCHDKYLVPRGSLSIATVMFGCYRLETIATSLVSLVSYIATPNDYVDRRYCNALFGSIKQYLQAIDILE
jgi:hypothetical protein